MAAKSIDMTKLKELIRLRMEHTGIREIGRSLDMDKKTVSKYVKLVEKDPLGLDGLLSLDDPVLEHRYTNGNAAFSDDRFKDLMGRLEYIAKELQKTGVTLYLLWQEYKQDYPDGYGYTQFCFHVNQHLKTQHLSFKMEREGGKEIFVDFTGSKPSYVDRETGEVVECEVFVASLPASDYSFALAVPSQTIDDFVYAINECFKFLGGTPKIIVTDNLKAAVTKADRYEPTINHIMERLADHYGCVTIPARACHPKDKPNAEGDVRIVYQRIFAPLRNKTYFSIDEINKDVRMLIHKHNQTRMQQYNATREERFLALEQPALKPLNVGPYLIEYETELTVINNSHVYLGRDKHYYSVPFKYIGKKVKVIYTRELVSIYADGKKIAVHRRDRTPGGYTTDKTHMPSYYDDYAHATPQRYIDRAYRASAMLGEVIRRIFASHPDIVPERFYKSCDGLLHLQKTSDPLVFEKACKAALLYDKCNYPFIGQMVKTKCAGLPGAEHVQEDLFPTADHPNLRGKKYYTSTTKNPTINGNHLQ